MRRKNKYKKQRKIIIISSLILLISLAAGYAAFSTNINLNTKGNIKKYSTEKLGYITENLKVAYDTKVGLTNDKTYLLDISNNEKNGKLINFENPNINDGLTFNGINTYVLMKQLNYENITMQIVLEYNAITEGQYNYTFNNLETGGYGFSVDKNNHKNTFDVYLKDYGYLFWRKKENQYLDDNNNEIENAKTNKKYFLSESYDGKKLTLYENNHKYFINKEGTISYPKNNTPMIIGGNPTVESLETNFIPFNGKIYSVRIYDRALTVEEIIQNYNIDKNRFNIEE